MTIHLDLRETTILVSVKARKTPFWPASHGYYNVSPLLLPPGKFVWGFFGWKRRGVADDRLHQKLLEKHNVSKVKIALLVPVLPLAEDAGRSSKRLLSGITRVISWL